MAQSAKYAMVKEFYDAGVWNEARVKNAVVKGWITEAEYKTITGKVYKAA